MKRLITILCVVAMLVSTLTITSFAISENNGNNNEKYVDSIESSEKVTKTLPVEISEKRVLRRIDNLDKLLGGKYFTVNQKSCGSEANHGCSNCGMVDVVETKWFDKTVGFKPIDWNYYPNHYYLGHKYYWGMSCCGFATYAGWYIYAQKETDNVVYNKKGTYFFNEKNAEKYCKPGDIVRLDGRHSAVYVSCNEEGIEVLDCNWRTDGTNCEVRRHIIEYDNYSLMCVSRALNNKGESEYAVKVVNPEDSSQNITIPFRKGERVSLNSYTKLTKVGHYQIGWAKKPNKNKAKYDMDKEFAKSVTLYPVWKEYDNKTLVVIGAEAFSPTFFMDKLTDRIKIVGEIPIGTQEDAKNFPVVQTILSQNEIDSCVKGNKANKKYIIVFVRCNKKGEKIEIINIRYADEFVYKKFVHPPVLPELENNKKK